MKKFIVLSFAFACGFSSFACSNNKIVLVELGDRVELNNAYIAEFLKNPVDDGVSEIANGKVELSRPKPVPLSWTSKGINSRPFVIKVSEKEDMSNPLVYTTNNNKYDLYNCKINTKYYWTVETPGFKSDVKSFASSGLEFRNIYIDGVTNCRDLGGHKTEQGKEIKQGLLYRTGRYNVSNTPYVMRDITPTGCYTYKNELKIKTELDIRGDDNYETGGITLSGEPEKYRSVINDEAFDKEVVHYQYRPMRWRNKDTGEDIKNLVTDEKNKEQIKAIFNEDLANENNYPLSFHCNIGTDRTGAIAYTVLALCGVPKKTLIADYLMSSYGMINSRRYFSKIKNSYPKDIDDCEGDNLMQKTENFLTTKIGVTADSIAKIKSILIK